MAIYSDHVNASSMIDSRGKHYTALGVFFLTIILLLGGSVNAVAAETEKQAQIIKKQKYYNGLSLELREVRKKYPELAKKLGLVHQRGVRLPLLCIGGVDSQCHRAIQQSCINNSIGKPDYQHCLDLANRICCEPAVIKQ